MPRPRKCRSVCHFPQTQAFVPVDGEGGEWVILTVDEYETIRLIDLEGYSQEECGGQMGIARTTVQQIYTTARRKLAEVLVRGLPLRIEGGDYRLCSGQGDLRACGSCFKREFREKYGMEQGEGIMRIAVTYEDGQIFQHFGHSEQFKIYEVMDGKVVRSAVASTSGSGHGALAGVLNALNVEVLICGGIGGGARAALDAAGIQICGGVSGDADAAVEALLAGELVYDPNVMCSHHGEHGNHACGEHGCGSHGCH